MEESTRGSGSVTNNMGLERRSGTMVQRPMKESSEMEKRTDKVVSNGMTAPFIKVNF
jgi:hypothetical protein